MVFLRDIPLKDALARWQEGLADAGLGGLLGEETIPLDESALGRVLARSVIARTSSPHYHASAMDGFAIRAESTRGAGPLQPVTLNVPDQAQYCDTGDPLPMAFDCVIPIENTETLDDHGVLQAGLRDPWAIRVRAAAVPWQHVRPLGEDMAATELVLPAGHVLRPVDLAAAAASGHSELIVARKPRVAVLPTGSELVPLGAPPDAGQIIESNGVLLAAQLSEWGGEPNRLPIVRDDRELLAAAVARAAEGHDMVLINAGSSAGAEDYTSEIVESLGELWVHGVAVRPGHPVILGILQSAERKVPVVGVPGYPVSAALTAEIFIEPVMAVWQSRRPLAPEVVEARITRKVTSPAGDDDYLRVSLGIVDGNLLATPLGRGAGVITSLVRADGIAVLSRGVQGASRGETVAVRLLRSMNEIRNTIVATGSHDLVLDLISEALATRERRLVSASVGSQAGLIALGRGETHIAGSHLLDPETGEYNLAFIPRYAPGIAVSVIGLVNRLQGLMVARGNPAGLRDLADLGSPGVRFVNRQRGSGTRVLLDYHLEKANMDGRQIAGYGHEEFTHLAVAAAVSSGRATAGLGVEAAARALDLDFIPLFHERYDIIVRQAAYQDALLLPLWELLEDSSFRARVAKLPGYDVEPMSRRIAEVG